MTVNWQIVAQIAAPLIALFVGALLNRAVESRPRLVTYLAHSSAHHVKRPDGEAFWVYTHSIVLRNTGRRPATNVRLAHNVLPNYNVTPEVEHSVKELPGGTVEIVIPSVVPGQQVQISYLYFPPIVWHNINGQVRSDEGLAKVLSVLPAQQYPRWFNIVGASLTVLGAITVLYLLAQLAIWIQQIRAVAAPSGL